jgi:hypothetical protein
LVPSNRQKLALGERPTGWSIVSSEGDDLAEILFIG